MIQTNNLPLKKHEGTDSASDMLDYANDNMDTINFAVGAPLSTLATTAKTIVGAINEISERPTAQSVSSKKTDHEFTLDATAGLWALYAKGVTANVGGIWLISSSSGTASSFKIGGSSSVSTTVSGNKVTFKTDSNYYRLYLVRLM